jgi:hypothetical protein
MKTFEEFKEYYSKYHRFPDGQYCRDKVLNEKQLYTKYCKYLKKLDKVDSTTSNHQQNIFDAEKEVVRRDPNKKEFWKNFTEEEKVFLRNKCNMFKDKHNEMLYDFAHIINRPKNKDLSENPLDIIQMPRYYHSLLDDYINPLTGKSITKEERTQLWIYIIGEEWYSQIEELLYKDIEKE